MSRCASCRGPAGRHVGDESGQRRDLRGAGVDGHSREAFRARDRGEQAVFRDGFEEVIHRVYRERVEGVRVSVEKLDVYPKVESVGVIIERRR